MAPRAKRIAGGEEAGRRPHGRLLAAEVGELIGVSGTTIGQWARRRYIRSSRRVREPRVYSVEDAAEAAVVAALLERGVGHAQVREAIGRLDDGDPWPLGRARLATSTSRRGARIALREPDGIYVLTHRGWQLTASPPALADLEPRLQRRRPF